MEETRLDRRVPEEIPAPTPLGPAAPDVTPVWWLGEAPAPAPDYERLLDPALGRLGPVDFVAELLRRVRSVLGTEMAGLLLLQPDGALRMAGFQGARGPVPARLLPSGWFLGRILETGHPVAKRERDLDHVQHPFLEQEGIRSLAGAPLVLEGEAMGVLLAAARSDHAFGARELWLLGLGACQAALTLDRARRRLGPAPIAAGPRTL